jgi:hypothetical protein
MSKVPGAAAQATPADPSAVATQVKAAYLYKFGGFVEWPASSFEGPDSPVKIGVVGARRMADALTQLVIGRTLNGRAVEVRSLRPDDTMAGLHILFIGTGSEDRLAEIFVAVREQPTLTVTESPRAFAMGSMINFVVVDGKLRFDIAPNSTRPAGLYISARLLVAARKVVARPS